jgi:mannosyltransferase OCH1-like enzyme
MRQPARFALLIVLGAVCWCLAWLGKGRYVGNDPRNKEQSNDIARSHFRFSDVVDEALESRLYDSLSLLEQSLRRHANTEWPQFIWQTSPTQGDTREMNSWKIRNPEWNHRVFFLSYRITNPQHYNDAEAYSLVEGLYQSIPEIVYVYRTFPLPVLRADLFRYLVLFAYGGYISTFPS